MIKRGRFVVVLACADGEGKTDADCGIEACEMEVKVGKGRGVLNVGCCVAEPAVEAGKLEEGRRKRGADGVKVGASPGRERRVC